MQSKARTGGESLLADRKIADLSVDLSCIRARVWLNRAVRTEASDSEPQTHGGVFATTHWSVVLAAGEQNTPQSAGPWSASAVPIGIRSTPTCGTAA